MTIPFREALFLTLPDSQLLKRLTFYRNLAPKYLLPLLRSNEIRPLQEIRTLLDEVKKLVEAWLGRARHPLAKLSPGAKEVGLIGFDVSDFGFDGDEDFSCEAFDKGKVNEELTKRVYPVFKKLFHQVFTSESECEDFIDFIRMVKDAIFVTFLNSLPQDVRAKLSVEVWDKIFSMIPPEAPNALRTMAKMGEDHAKGIMNPEKLTQYLIMERTTDLFGVAGDLHMLLVDTLFRPANHYDLNFLVQNDTTENKMLCLSDLIKRVMKEMRSKYERLLSVVDYQYELSSQDPPPCLELMEKIEQGLVYIKSRSHNPIDSRSIHQSCSDTFFRCQGFSEFMAFKVGQDKISFWNMVRNCYLTTVNCEFKDPRCSTVTITQSFFAALEQVGDDQDFFTVKWWKIDPWGEHAPAIDNGTFRGQLVPKGDINFKATERDGHCRYVIASNNSDGCKFVICSTNDPIQKEIDLPGVNETLCWIRGNRILTLNKKLQRFHMWHVRTGENIWHFQTRQTPMQMEESQSVIDCTPELQQFVILHKDSCDIMQWNLFRYQETCEPDGLPDCLAIGSLKFDLLGTISSVHLMLGSLYMILESCPMSVSWREVFSHFNLNFQVRVVAYDCFKDSSYHVAGFMVPSQFNDHTLRYDAKGVKTFHLHRGCTNEFSRKFYLERNYPRAFRFANSTTMIVAQPRAHLLIQFPDHADDVTEADMHHIEEACLEAATAKHR